jgi:AraC-like DNA-binding protein
VWLLDSINRWPSTTRSSPSKTSAITGLSDPSRRPAAALRDRGITAALQAIHGDPAGPWTVEELGRRAGLSRAAFARRFTMLVGQPPLAYLTWWRMTTAGRLLREDDVPLRTVAHRAGYASEFAFAKAFKREYGMAPGQYRRRAG